jgi:hypothetical protein
MSRKKGHCRVPVYYYPSIFFARRNDFMPLKS